MKITSVDLKISAVRRSQYPTDERPEYLLVGRSNVGKSSFINTLMNRKNYARTSATPGKTQTINFYLVNEDFYLVDAPGYGYAKVSKSLKNKFRHKPSNDDIMMYNYLKYHKIPVTIVATKVDKVGVTLQQKQRSMILEELDLVVGDDFELFSSVTKLGKKEIYEKIERTK